MKMRSTILFLLNLIFLVSCSGVTPIPVTETPTLKVETQINTPSLTNTPTLTSAFWETPTPETISGYPTLQLPIVSFAPNVAVQQKSLSINDLYIGKYVLRNWCKVDETIQWYCAITISSLGEKQVEIGGLPSHLAPETGTDLTGRGYPDIVVISEIGNAAGEQVVRVFEAGDTLKEILMAGGRPDWKFEDLNNDKSFEFIGDARVWSQFSDCQILNFPYVYEYNGVSGYVNKTSKFNEILPSIELDLDSLNSYKIENPNIEVPLCQVYRLVSTYLVSGQTEKAWNILDENYPAEKAEAYKIGFLGDLHRLLP